MNDNQIDDALKDCFGAKFTMDCSFKAEVKRKLHERREQRSNFLLCLIQTAMFVLTLIAVAVAFIVDQRFLTFLIGYALISGFIATVIVCYSKNKILTLGVESYD